MDFSNLLTFNRKLYTNHQIDQTITSPTESVPRGHSVQWQGEGYMTDNHK